MERMTITATLPSGREVLLQELSGNEELSVAREIGEASGTAARMIGLRSTLLRSLRMLDGKPFDPSLHTGESLRDSFSQKDWQALVITITRLTAINDAEHDALENSFRYSAA